MTERAKASLLAIGEFAAATQLSAKALRLYDDERILRPAEVDATTGYRYYRREQIAAGRLIRTLREMELPLTAIAQIVRVAPAQADALLSKAAQDTDRRYARQKRAFQSGLAMLHRMASSDTPSLSVRERPALTAVVHLCAVTRTTLLQRLRMKLAITQSLVEAANLTQAGEPFCVLLEPLSEDDSRVEIALPIVAPAATPRDISLRNFAAVSCAVHELRHAGANTTDIAPDIEAALDSMFDWMDRHGHCACEAPSIVCAGGGSASTWMLSWGYEPVAIHPETSL